MLIQRAAFVAAFALSSSFALAHVAMVPPEAQPGQVWQGGLRIGHGCEKSPTIRVEATLPAALSAPKPLAKPGWTVNVSGNTLVWSGGSLPDDHFDEFVFRAAVAKDAPLGGIAIPVVQICEKGEHRWTEIAQPGQDSHALKSPAPVLKIVQQAGVSFQDAWLRATPKGAKVAGGFGLIVNGGGADRLVSATFPAVAGKTEIHEMAVANGVMTMRPLANGIEIPASGKIELKPGSFHLMLMDLKTPLIEGQTIEGTLVFEKAGPVQVRFPVMAIGAPGPMQHHKH